MRSAVEFEAFDLVGELFGPRAQSLPPCPPRRRDWTLRLPQPKSIQRLLLAVKIRTTAWRCASRPPHLELRSAPCGGLVVLTSMSKSQTGARRAAQDLPAQFGQFSCAFYGTIEVDHPDPPQARCANHLRRSSELVHSRIAQRRLRLGEPRIKYRSLTIVQIRDPCGLVLSDSADKARPDRSLSMRCCWISSSNSRLQAIRLTFAAFCRRRNGAATALRLTFVIIIDENSIQFAPGASRDMPTCFARLAAPAEASKRICEPEQELSALQPAANERIAAHG